MTQGEAVRFALEIQLIGAIVGIVAAVITLLSLAPMHH
jgi:hypothetical protein